MNKIVDLVKTDCLILILLSIFYLYGVVIEFIFRIKNNEHNSFRVLSGLCFIAVFGWFSYICGMSLPTSISISLQAPYYILGIICLYHCLYLKKPQNLISQNLINFGKNIFIVVTICCGLFILITHASPHSVLSLHNFDLINWTLMGDSFNGYAKYLDAPHKRFFLDNLEVSFGTNYLIGFISKFLNLSSIEAITYILILISSINILLIIDFVKKYFALNFFNALILSFFVCFNSFYIYLLFHHFMGYLFSCLFFIGYFLKINQILDTKLNQKTYYILISVIGVFIFYTYGGYVFHFGFLLSSFIYYALQIDSQKKIKLSIKSALAAFSIVFTYILFLIVLFPNLFLNLIRDLYWLSNVAAGWPLPVMQVYMLLFPSFLQGSAWPHLSILNFSFNVLVIYLAYLALINILSKKEFINALRFIGIISVNIIIYYIYFYFKGETYQTWKLASYLILPLNVIYFVVLNVALNNYLKFDLKIFLSVVLITGTAFFSYKSSIKNFDLSVLQAKELNKNLQDNPKIKNICLLKDQSIDIGIAYNILVNKFNGKYCNFEDANSILLNSDGNMNQNNTVMIKRNIVSNCQEGDINHNNCISYEILSWDKVKHIINIPLVSKMHFKEIDYLNPFNIERIQGFRGIESWGIWSIGNLVVMKFVIPNAFKNIPKTFNLNLSCFLGGYKSQDFTVEINGRKIGEYSINKDTEIKLPLTDDSNFELRIYIKHPVKPCDVDKYSLDCSALALGFISYKLQLQ